MTYQITVLPGDGIGPEITQAATAVLKKIGEQYGHRFLFTTKEIGGCAIDRYGIPLPEETLSSCLS